MGRESDTATPVPRRPADHRPPSIRRVQAMLVLVLAVVVVALAVRSAFVVLFVLAASGRCARISGCRISPPRLAV